MKQTNCYIYCPGYENYDSDDDFNDVIGKSPFAINDNSLRQEIVFNANIEVKTHSYESRVNEMLSYVLNKNK